MVLDSNRWQDSVFLELDSGFQSPGFRISEAKSSWIPESGFPYMGRSISRTTDFSDLVFCFPWRFENPGCCCSITICQPNKPQTTSAFSMYMYVCFQYDIFASPFIKWCSILPKKRTSEIITLLYCRNCHSINLLQAKIQILRDFVEYVNLFHLLFLPTDQCDQEVILQEKFLIPPPLLYDQSKLFY